MNHQRLYTWAIISLIALLVYAVRASAECTVLKSSDGSAYVICPDNPERGGTYLREKDGSGYWHGNDGSKGTYLNERNGSGGYWKSPSPPNPLLPPLWANERKRK